jgi:hypothetical protein
MPEKAILTFWTSGSSIPDTQVKALKTLLKLVGATSVRKMANGSIQSEFKNWKSMEKANKDILTPLQILFQSADIDSTFGPLKM